MSKRLFWALMFSCIVCIGSSANADVVEIVLTGDDANSDVAGTLNGLESSTFLLSDTFAYDPLNPTTPNPDINYATNVNGWHADVVGGGDSIVSFTLNYTVGAADELVFDAWGRSGNGGNRFNRDDDFDVFLYSGGLGGTVVGSALNQGIPDPNTTRHNRSTFAPIAAGTVIDAIQIVGRESAGRPNNNFTLTEVRFADISAVPEPSAGLFLVMASVLGLSRRRRK